MKYNLLATLVLFKKALNQLCLVLLIEDNKHPWENIYALISKLYPKEIVKFTGFITVAKGPQYT